MPLFSHNEKKRFSHDTAQIANLENRSTLDNEVDEIYFSLQDIIRTRLASLPVSLVDWDHSVGKYDYV